MLDDRCKDVTAESLVIAGFPVSLRSRKQSSSARTTGFPRGLRAAVRFWTQWVSCPGPNVARAISMHLFHTRAHPSTTRRMRPFFAGFRTAVNAEVKSKGEFWGNGVGTR